MAKKKTGNKFLDTGDYGVKKNKAEKQSSSSSSGKNKVEKATTVKNTNKAVKNYSSTNMGGSQYSVKNASNTAKQNTRTTTPKVNTNTVNNTVKNHSTTNMGGSQYSVANKVNKDLEQRRQSELDKNRQKREYANEQMRNQKSGLDYDKKALDTRMTDLTKGTAKQIAGGHLTSLGHDSNDANEFKKSLDQMVLDGKIDQETADKNYESYLKSNTKANRDQDWKDTKLHKTFQKIEQKGIDLNAKGDAQVQKGMEGLKGGKKLLADAYTSGVGMLSDMAFGPAWAGSMMSRSFGNELNSKRGLVGSQNGLVDLKTGEVISNGDGIITEKEAENNAGLQALKEVGTEYMFAGFGLAKNLKGVGAFTESLDAMKGKVLDNLTSKISNKILKNITYSGLKGFAGYLEEGVEEIAGGILEPRLANLAYANKVDKRMENSFREGLLANSSDINTQIDYYVSQGYDRDSIVNAYAEQIMGEENYNDMYNSFLESGMSDKQAKKMATAMQNYMVANLNGDKKAMQKAENEMLAKYNDAFSIKEKFSAKDTFEAAASAMIMASLTGGVGHINTTAKGMIAKQTFSNVEGAMNAASAISNMAMGLSDEKMAARAKAMYESAQNGNDLALEQYAELQDAIQKQTKSDAYNSMIAQATGTNLANKQRYFAKPQVEMAEDGSFNYIGEVTNQRASDIENKVRESFNQYSEAYGDVQSEDASNLASNITAIELGFINAEAVANFTTNHPEARAIYESVTGVTLPETNQATRDFLFKRSAANYENTARLETINTVDSKKGQLDVQYANSFGSEGQEVFQNLSQNIGLENSTDYVAYATAMGKVYDAGVNGLSMEEAMRLAEDGYAISSEDAELMYKAGANDKTIKKSGGTVKYEVSDAAKIKSSEREAFGALARAFNVNIKVTDNLTTGGEVEEDGVKKSVGQQVNGQYDPKTNTITLNLNKDVRVNVGYTLMHEFTHSIKEHFPSEYDQFAKLFKERWENNVGAEEVARIIKAKQDAYKRVANQDLTKDEALEEIICDQMGEVLHDTDFLNKVAEENPNVAQALLYSIRDILRKIRQVFATYGGFPSKYNGAMLSQLDMLKEAETLLSQAMDRASEIKTQEMLEKQSGGTKFLITERAKPSDVTEEDVLELLEKAKTGRLNKRSYIPVRANTPEFIIALAKEYGLDVENRPMIMPVIKAIQAMEDLDYSYNGNKKPHGMTSSDIVEIMRRMAMPEMVCLQNNGRLGVIVKSPITNGAKGFSIVDFDAVLKNQDIMNGYEGGGYNVVVTTFEATDEYVENYLENYEVEILYNKNDLSQGSNIGGISPSLFNDKPFSDKNVSQNEEVVKQENPYEDIEKMFLDSAKLSLDDYSSETDKDYIAADSIKYSLVTDRDTINALENDKHRTTYRAMLLIDGKLYPPMASLKATPDAQLTAKGNLSKADGNLELQTGIEIGQWVEAEPTTDSKMFNDKGQYHLIKDDGTDMFVAYNPFIHSSDTMMNDQFASYHRRPNLVVVEGVIPESELYSGEKAITTLDDGRVVESKDTTGIVHNWNSGVVNNRIKDVTGEKRTVFLTNHYKPVRIVPDNEVAKHIYEKVSPYDIAIPYNVVPPKVRKELLKLGAKMEQSKEDKYRVELDDEDINLLGRLSISEETIEALDDQGVALTEGGTAVRYSVESWANTKKDKLKEKLLAVVDKDGNPIYSEEEVDKWINDINTVSAIILADFDRLGYIPMPNHKMKKKNGDYYRWTLDSSTLCAKRRLYQGTYNLIQKMMPNAPLLPDDVIEMRKMLDEAGYESPCGVCYVESQRKMLGKYAKDWYDTYPDKDKITLADVTATDGLEKLRTTNPKIYKDFTKAMKKKGVQSPKVVELRTEYREDLNRMPKKSVEYLNRIGGIRVNSFSDFETPHLIDMMQAIIDMSKKQLKSMAYTKVPNFAWAFGNTGMKINLSLIAKVDENGNVVRDKDGKLVFDEKEGMPIEEAMALRDAFPDNIAIIVVGKDMQHVIDCLNDDRIDFVIPFHRSKWTDAEFEKLGLRGYEDFATGHQDTHGIFMNDFWEEDLSPVENTQIYFDKCREKGVKPIFDQLLIENEDGTYSLPSDHSLDNYWKLLAEGKVYNHITGEYAAQKVVRPDFNMDEIKRILDEYEGGADSLPAAEDVAERFVENYKQNHPGMKFSVDSEGNELSEQQTKFFFNSKVRDALGRLKVFYHGTTSGGFTIFDPMQSDDHRSLFLTDNRQVAMTYIEDDLIDEEERQKFVTNPIADHLKVPKNETMVIYGPEYFRNMLNQLDEEDSSYAENFKSLNTKLSEIEAVDNGVGVQFGNGDIEVYDIYQLASELSNKYVDKNYSGMLAPTYDELPNELKGAISNPEWITFDSDGIKQLILDALGQGNLTGDIYDSIPNYTMDQTSNKTGVYPCYVNLENPLIVDADGSNWNLIVPKGYDAYKLDFYEWDGKWELTLQKAEGKSSLEDYQEYYEPIIDFERFETEEDGIEAIREVLGDVFVKEYLDEVKGGDRFIYNPKANQMMDEPGTANNFRETTASTRSISEWAYNNGYDGVIFENLIDVGQGNYGYMEASTIVVAFKPEQIKLIDNTEPTNNPDIRFSTPTQDELDDRQMNNPKDDMFLDGDISDEMKARRVKIQDEIAAELAHIIRKDVQYTHGKTLEVKSIKPQITELVRSTMANSENTNKEKRETTKMVMEAAQVLWRRYGTKRDAEGTLNLKRSELAELQRFVMDVSKDVVENTNYIDDSIYNEYQTMRDYIRSIRIEVPNGVKSDIDFAAYRRKNLGRMTLVNEHHGGTAIDVLWDDMKPVIASFVSEEFDLEEIDTQAEMFLAIESALDNTKAYRDAYASEFAQDLEMQFAKDFLNIVLTEGQAWKSFADKKQDYYNERTKQMKARHKEAMREQRMKFQKEIKEVKASEREKRNIQRMKYLQKEAERKQKAREQRQAKKDHKERMRSWKSIGRNYDALVKKLNHPKKELGANIPEEFREALATVLKSFDLQTENSVKIEFKTGKVAKTTLAMRDLRDALSKIAPEDDSGVFLHNGAMFGAMEILVRDLNDRPLRDLNNSELEEIDVLLASIKHAIDNENKLLVKGQKESQRSAGETIIREFQEKIAKYGRGYNYTGAKGKIHNLLNTSMLTPGAFFKSLGGQMEQMYKNLRYAQDDYIRDMNYLRGFFGDLFKPYQNKKKPGSAIEDWQNDKMAQTITLRNGSVIKMTVAQMMSLYCLSKRPQAMEHMITENGGVGIILADVTSTKGVDKVLGQKQTGTVSATAISYDDVVSIAGMLTKEQKHIADELQKLMNGRLQEWGNETSMQLYGIKLFTEDNYFPIEVSSGHLDSQIGKASGIKGNKISNFGFTKPLVEHPNNPIVIGDIFDIVADHSNKMALYHSYAAALTDFNRVLNYKSEENPGVTVKSALQEAYGHDAMSFIDNLLADINGQAEARMDGVNDLYNTALANYKKAAIGANLRVLVQQPTAIVRSLSMINAKYFVGIPKNLIKERNEMHEHCPIAAWKAWGNYQNDYTRSLSDIMFNKDWNRFDTVTMGMYGFADDMTWAIIWGAVKNEVKDKHPGVKEGSEEFWILCNERASEVFDDTQVVDSVFHRSDAMRQKGVTKIFTAFMAEPTKTYNMMRSQIVESYRMYQDGDKQGAARGLAKVTTVLILNAAAVSAAAAVIDAMRGKGDDDDDETWVETFLRNFWENFYGLGSNSDPLAMIVFCKDIENLFINAMDGNIFGGTQNMALEGWWKLAQGCAEFKSKVMTGEESFWAWMFGDPEKNTPGKFLSGLGYVTGIPTYTIVKDFKTILNKFGIQVYAGDGLTVPSLDKSDSDTGWSNSGSSAGWSNSKSNSLGIVDGSGLDNFLNRFGFNLTAEEKAEREWKSNFKSYEKQVKNLSGEAKDKKVRELATSGYKDAIESGDYTTIKRMRQMVSDLGGNVDDFDEKVSKATVTAYKKCIGGDADDTRRMIQMRNYLLDQGWSEYKISSDIVYKSDAAREFKAACRSMDNDAMRSTLEPLVAAGLTKDDAYKLYKNRNMGNFDKSTTGKLKWATEGTISSDYGYRNCPYHGYEMHEAIDIAAPLGTTVTASDGGTVIFAGYDGSGYGNYIRVQHANGVITQYSHLDYIDVRKGQNVGQGQYIGNVGSTGNSTGPHLDFRVEVNGQFVNPHDYLN